MPTKRDYETKDLEYARQEAEFRAEMRTGMAEINKKMTLTLELVQLHGSQIQGLTTSDTLMQRDISDAKAQASSFDNRLKSVESTPVDLRHSVERIERMVSDSVSNNKNSFDSVFQRLRLIDEKLQSVDVDKQKKLNDEIIPAWRFTKWSGAIVVGSFLLSIVAAVKAFMP